MTTGVAALGAAACAGAAAWLLVRPSASAGRLAAALPGAPAGDPPRPPSTPVAVRLRTPAAALAGLALALVLDGGTGWVLGALAAIGLDRWTARAQPRADRDRLRRREAALPGAVDLVVACLRAGATPTAAVAAVVPAVTDDLADDLRAVVARSARGATPAEAWAAAAPDLYAVARVLQRSEVTGAPAADLLDALASDLRSRRRSAWLEEANRLGVKAAAPLGLCFLPGFTLLGVVPVVIGLADELW